MFVKVNILVTFNFTKVWLVLRNLTPDFMMVDDELCIIDHILLKEWINLWLLIKCPVIRTNSSIALLEIFLSGHADSALYLFRNPQHRGNWTDLNSLTNGCSVRSTNNRDGRLNTECEINNRSAVNLRSLNIPSSRGILLHTHTDPLLHQAFSLIGGTMLSYQHRSSLLIWCTIQIFKVHKLVEILSITSKM